jgi:putative ABC transport system permease protein
MPDWNAIVRSRLGALGGDPIRESDVVDELAQHVAQHYAELVASGLDEETALARAVQPLNEGRTGLAKAIAGADRPRATAVTPPAAESRLAPGVWRDLTYAARLLKKSPGFAVVAICTIALGIGANTAIFSIFNALLLRPLPFADADQLASIGERTPEGAANNVGYETFADWRQRTHSFEEMAFIRLWTPTLVAGGDPERISALRVSSNYFRMLGVLPAIGRDFRSEEDTPATWRVAILSDGLWRRRFGADPSIVGRNVSVNDQPFTIIGVLPASYEPLISEHFYQRAEMWAPAGYDSSLPFACRTCQHLRAIGRIKHGVSFEAALADLDAVQQQLVKEFPTQYVQTPMALIPLRGELTGNMKPALTALMGAVGLVLLIACANVANLLLARTARRQHDLALRTALGATRVRLMRQLFIESSLLAIAGGAVGATIGIIAVPALATLAPDAMARAFAARFDGRVLAFTLVIAATTAILFGLVPALRASQVDPGASLQGGSRRSAAAPTTIARRMLIAVDVALAVVLLVSAGLMIRSVARLLGVDPGFDPDHVLTMHVSMGGRAYADNAVVVAKGDAIVARLHELPGVQAVALAGQVPLGGDGDRWSLRVEGQPSGPDDPFAERYSVTPEYFAAMRIPLIRGRLIQESDRAGTENVMLIGERTANTLWPNADPLGQHVKIGGEPTPWRTVVGVVGNVRHEDLAAPPTMQFYTPQAQLTDSGLTVVIRSTGDPAILASEGRRAIRSVVPDAPVFQVAPLDQLVRRSVGPRRFVMILLELFGLAALLLTAIGVYGLIAGSVSERTREIGVRAALGATRTEILHLVIRDGLGVVCGGLLAGTAAALGTTRYLRGSLYGVSPVDPLTFAAVAGVLLAVATLAQLVPAVRATRVDPSVAVRHD